MTRLLLGMTGSLGMLSMPAYLIQLRQHFSEVKLIITHSASQFMARGCFEMLSDGVYTSEFPISQANMMHIELARWAQLFAVIPASGHVLAQAAHGFADTLLSATILAYEKRVIFFPNMNSAMWKNQALQRNVSLLREYGHKVVDPIEKPAFEYASRKIEVNHVLPSVESVLSMLKIEGDLS